MNELINRWRSFYDRRVRIPVGPEALVLDVGSGDKPFWRADVLLDRYPDEAHAGQRSGSGHTKVDRPLFDADAAEMPFKDGAFDYAICSHVLEHVVDPVGVVSELVRVAKAGYIEVPEASAAKIIDFPSHLWWCRLDATALRPTLVFTAKSAPSFDDEIEDYLARTGLGRKFQKLINAHHHQNVVAIRWRGSQPARSEGILEPAFVEKAVLADAHHRSAEAFVSALAVKVLTPGKVPRSRKSIRFDDIVRPEFSRGDGSLLNPGIYRLGT